MCACACVVSAQSALCGVWLPFCEPAGNFFFFFVNVSLFPFSSPHKHMCTCTLSHTWPTVLSWKPYGWNTFSTSSYIMNAKSHLTRDAFLTLTTQTFSSDEWLGQTSDFWMSLNQYTRLKTKWLTYRSITLLGSETVIDYILCTIESNTNRF